MKPPRSRTIALARQIADLAARCGWSEGRHVTELELARQLGLSRTPVRAAMKVLIELRLVEARPNQGFFLLRDGAAFGSLHLEAPAAPEDLLYGQILKDRISNALPSEVSRGVLSARYAVSRPILDHVVGRLVDDGLLMRGAGRSWRFVETMNDIDSVRASYDFRLMLEPASLLLDTFRPDSGVLNTLRERHVALLTDIGDATVPEDIRRQRLMRRSIAVALDADFHGGLAGFTGNPFLVAAVRQQIDLRRLLELGTYEEAERVMAWSNEHIVVIDALLAGDPGAAAAALRHHLARAERDALRSIEVSKAGRDEEQPASR
ncbi:FCD domain-containing protein [Phreatobacter cathodiphilus]|uniref:Transcriptional regulator n=1 Tax=Phreatobacter cathodiphilus TaxID=1868589 RepID=A0A2S0N8X8_9HYPH|nr:FCD domain-containing protein [Phreatobacter cathodiphilus]AVO44383.1 transcriptional regulator [Phreatobacter cathodiphilus]